MRPPPIARFALALPLVIVSAGCGDQPAADGHTGQAEEAVQVCPWGPTVPGIDVSYYQGAIDWGSVAASGMTFAIARINDGNFMDPEFGANWGGIKAVGMIRGAYQFYEPTMDAAAQANVAVGAVGALGPGDLPVTLDVEWTQGTPNAGAIQTWVDIVAQGTGKRPMIYTALGYWNQYFNGELGQVDLWAANWAVSCPNLADSWQDWVFWQWGGGGVPGISGDVDQDVFNGALEDLQLLANVDGSQNCRSSAGAACAHYGCHCVDDQCNGGYCPGTGCTAQHTSDCGQFGCGCVDGQCDGVYCPGTGCTAKEALDCPSFGCNCVDHACSGGACDGTGCTAAEVTDCGAYGCGCVDHGCSGGACDGTGCTAKQAADCQGQGQACSLGVCVADGSGSGGAGGGGAATSGGSSIITTGAVTTGGANDDAGDGGNADAPAPPPSGCSSAPAGESRPGLLLLIAIAGVAIAARRRVARFR